jgi:uncharacterized protein (DUF488 family)
MVIHTIGHSTRPFDEFLAVLRAHEVEAVADVRTVPKSRHNPQFHIDSLTRTLPEAGLDYVHLRKLGGLRHARPDSPNTGWRNASFRGYADYMQTPEFAAALDELLGLARRKRTVIMCAEAVPWRCHRSLVGDALLVRGHEVIDIYDAHTAKPERLTSFAVVHGLVITYPASAV